MRCAFALFALAGCLSRPTGLSGDAAVDATGDGTVNPGQPWPPAGLTVLRTAASDVDGDGVIDLAVAATDGVYFLRGEPGFGAKYHGFVGTPAAPVAFGLANLGGSAAPELVTLERGPTNKGRLEIYEGTGSLAFATTAWQRDLTTLAPDAIQRRGVWLVDSDGDGTKNIVVADDRTLVIDQLGALSATGLAATTFPAAVGANSGFFTAPNDVFAATRGGSTDLVVDDGARVSVFHGGVYTNAARTDHSYNNPYTLSTHLDLDGDGAPEICGGENDQLGVMSYAGPFVERGYPAPPEFTNPAGVKWIAARGGNVDRDAASAPDLVLLRNFDAGSDVVVIRNPTLATNVTATGVVAKIMNGSRVSLEVGDFDHDGAAEIIAIASDGAVTCFRYGNLALVGC